MLPEFRLPYGIKSASQKEIFDVEMVQGCFFVIDAHVMKAIDNFDERTFLYHEEQILGKKIQTMGKKEFILPHEPIIHYQGSSISHNITHDLRKYRYKQDSTIIYLKHYLDVSGGKLLFYKAVSSVGILENYCSIKLWIFLKNSRKKVKKKDKTIRKILLSALTE